MTVARPLAGVRVVDLTRLIPGGYATSLLVGLGADVVKVEEPGRGDGSRSFPPFADSGESSLLLGFNRGKRSVALDLKHPDGVGAMLALVAASDVLVDSFRPGVLDRLGLGPAALARANPRLVHVSLTGYGHGQRATRPGHDLNMEGYAGILGQARGEDGAPGMPPIPMADMATGLQAALAVLTGLRVVGEPGPTSTDAEGPAFRADVAMVDAALSINAASHGVVLATGHAPRVPDDLTGRHPAYGIYRCADGLEIVFAALEPAFFSRVAALVGDASLTAIPHSHEGRDLLRDRLSALFLTRPRQDWLDLLEDDQTCVSPVLDARQALDDPDLRSRGVLEEVRLADGTTRWAPRPLPWIVADPVAGPVSVPALGGDTDEVLASLGLDVAALRAAGAAG